MKNNKIILTVLTVIFLGNQLMLAQEQFQASHSSLQEGGQASTATPDIMPNAAKSGLVNRLNKEWRTFRDALKCLHQKGFRTCNWEQKKRIIAAGIVLLAGLGLLIYGLGSRSENPEQLIKHMEKLIAKQKEQIPKLSRSARTNAERVLAWQEKELERFKNRTDFLRAVENKDEDKLKRILASKRLDLNVGKYSTFEFSPLVFTQHWQRGMELLIAAGADVDAIDVLGFTPLHRAIRRQDANLALFLIRHGANPYVKHLGGILTKSWKGKTPLDMTTNESFKKRLLEEYRLRRATIGYSIQRAAAPETELLDPTKGRLPALPKEMIRKILKQAN